MNKLTLRIGSHTITRLERAAPLRLAEASCLRERGHNLAAIYLSGYAAEMVVGSAYFRLLGYRAYELIEDDRLRRVLDNARGRSAAIDLSHPLDGLGRLLVADRLQRTPPGYARSFGAAIIKRVDAICQHWAPKLRYRDFDADAGQAGEVIEAAEWLLSESPNM